MKTEPYRNEVPMETEPMHVVLAILSALGLGFSLVIKAYVLSVIFVGLLIFMIFLIIPTLKRTKKKQYPPRRTR